MAPTSLSRLSRDSLLDLAIRWLENSSTSHAPYLSSNRDMFEAVEEDYLYTPAENIEELRSIYRSLKDEKKATKRDIVDRIVEGDWRRGLSLHQLAMVDLRYLEENDTCLRWNALKLMPLSTGDDSDDHPAKKRRRLNRTNQFPEIQPETFLQSLKREISPLVKAHYYLYRLPPPYDLVILRLYITDLLFPNSKASTRSHSLDAARTIYIALPTSCPYVYVAVSGSSGGQSGIHKRGMVRPDIASMKRTILEAIPKALSRPQERYALESTDLSVRSLRTISEMRGTGRATESNGVYSLFAEAVVDSGPLNTKGGDDFTMKKTRNRRKRKRDNIDEKVLSRFGPGLQHAALDRLHVAFHNISKSSKSQLLQGGREPPESETDSVQLSLSFSGTDVILGIRNLALLGPTFIDLEKMPAWMTGEMGVSRLTV